MCLCFFRPGFQSILPSFLRGNMREQTISEQQKTLEPWKLRKFFDRVI